MGCGRTGSLLAQELDKARHEVTVIDWDAGAFSRLPDSFGGDTVLGNAVDQDVLVHAGVEEADAFVAATSGDNRNVMACEIAQNVFQVPKVVVRIKDPNRAKLYSQLGLEVDCRTREGARILLDLVADFESSERSSQLLS